MMKLLSSLALAVFLVQCGPDKALLKETKLDTPLKLKLESLERSDSAEVLTVFGNCMVDVNGAMRSDLINAGADVQEMKGDTFVATVSSDDLYHVAALEFVLRLELLKGGRSK